MGSSNHLFSKFGVELEYMIVDQKSLDVRPMADRLILTEGNERKNDVLRGDYRWSNELVMHVLELKTGEPVTSMKGVAKGFQQQVKDANALLDPLGCRLLPTAMHPWMDPHKETELWPHGDREIYETFDRIFDCRGHGWSNLQSTHLNLPFDGDKEFRRLHSAIRVLLPALPALAASSPFMEGKQSHFLDTRLETYRKNCAKIPSVTGRVVPERVRSHAQYDEKILQPMYRDIAPFDEKGILQDEWLNARGAIARFERGTIEIRVLDIQECPLADLAILQFIVWVLEQLVDERWSRISEQELPSVHELKPLLLTASKSAEDTLIEVGPYTHAFGITHREAPTLGEFWWCLFERYAKDLGDEDNRVEVMKTLLKQGSLGRRIRRAVGKQVSMERLREVYSSLADCLTEGRIFIP